MVIMCGKRVFWFLLPCLSTRGSLIGKHAVLAEERLLWSGNENPHLFHVLLPLGHEFISYSGCCLPLWRSCPLIRMPLYFSTVDKRAKGHLLLNSSGCGWSMISRSLQSLSCFLIHFYHFLSAVTFASVGSDSESRHWEWPPPHYVIIWSIQGTERKPLG